jgi:ferritin-like metal-binding protein YciE
MKLESVETLFEEEIKDLYDAAKQLVRALSKLAKGRHNRGPDKSFSRAS